MPSISVPPILRVTDQQMPTGMPRWKTASPMSHRKWFTPDQKTDMEARVALPSGPK